MQASRRRNTHAPVAIRQKMLMEGLILFLLCKFLKIRLIKL
jgi:hypothetical protein